MAARVPRLPTKYCGRRCSCRATVGCCPRMAVCRLLHVTLVAEEVGPLDVVLWVPNRVLWLLRCELAVKFWWIPATLAALCGSGRMGIPPALNIYMPWQWKSDGAMYPASHMACASHSWRSRCWPRAQPALAFFCMVYGEERLV
jgi:hypothetical protein